jgi:hypothetical protein
LAGVFGIYVGRTRASKASTVGFIESSFVPTLETTSGTQATGPSDARSPCARGRVRRYFLLPGVFRSFQWVRHTGLF